MSSMIRQLTPILPILAGVSGVGLAWYTYRRNQPEGVRRMMSGSGRDVLIKTISPVHFQSTMNYGPWNIGEPTTHDHFLLSEEECEEKLKANATSNIVKRGKKPTIRFDVTTLGAKEGINEDRHAVNLVAQKDLPALKGKEGGFWQRWTGVGKSLEERDGDEDDLLMFSVIDGHCGYLVSDLLSKVLHPSLAYSLAEHAGLVGRDSADKAKLIGDTIHAIDHDIMRVPFSLLENPIPDHNVSPLLPFPSPAMVHLASMESMGACVTNVLIDEAADKVYVSNVGDCRAVAGWWNPYEKKWRCDVMSEIGDCNGDNDLEAERIRAEHPDNEKDTVICDLGFTKRLQGNSQPTRSMGDRPLKDSQDNIDALCDHFGVRHWNTKQPYLTPPYLTAKPEVVSRDLHPANGEQLKFIILSTDGIWDVISSEEATLLMAAHLNEPHQPSISKVALPSLHPLIPPQDEEKHPRPYPAEPLPGTTAENCQGSWTFEDDNAATHLLRNTLGRGDAWQRRRLLSMKNGMVKSMRDDLTALVVRFDDPEDPTPSDSAQPGSL